MTLKFADSRIGAEAVRVMAADPKASLQRRP